MPPHVEYRVIAHHRFAERGPHAARVPASHPGLTVLELEADPRAREAFRGGVRWLHADGSDSMTLRCRYRAYAQRGADGRWLPVPTPYELFPDADSIELIDDARSGTPR